MSQLTAWRELVRFGAFLSQNPHSSFFVPVHWAYTPRISLAVWSPLLVVMLRRSPRRELVDVVTYYWHFLGVLWIVLFGTLRLIT